MWELVVGPITKLIDKLIPDPAAREAAKLELLRQQQNGELEEIKQQMSAIIAEAQSSDPWTSRARPAFLYVIYALILTAIPMGLISAADPAVAERITTGFKGWLAALPPDLITLFGVGYLGYTGARTIDKFKAR